MSNGACLTCYQGFTINKSSGTCEIFFKDPNCKEFNTDNTCSKCSNRYFVSEYGKCSPVNPLCFGYNPGNGACTTCYRGYVLENGRCIVGSASDPNCK